MLKPYARTKHYDINYNNQDYIVNETYFNNPKSCIYEVTDIDNFHLIDLDNDQLKSRILDLFHKLTEVKTLRSSIISFLVELKNGKPETYCSLGKVIQHYNQNDVNKVTAYYPGINPIDINLDKLFSFSVQKGHLVNGAIRID